MQRTSNPNHAVRAAGLRPDSDQLNLASIERRRLQVWAVMALLLLSVSIALTLTSYWPDLADQAYVDVTTLKLAMVVLSASFTAYVFEKERAFRSLTRRLIRERELRARLDAEIRRLHGLVEEAQAMGAALEHDRLLYVVLGCVIDLVDGTGAAISLTAPDGLQLRRVRGHGVEQTPHARRAAEEAFDGGAPVRIASADVERGDFPGIVIPMRAGSTVVGVIDVRVEDPSGLDDLEIEVLESLTAHTATAMLHADRYEKARIGAGGHGAPTDAWSELEALARPGSPGSPQP